MTDLHDAMQQIIATVDWLLVSEPNGVLLKDLYTVVGDTSDNRAAMTYLIDPEVIGPLELTRDWRVRRRATA